MHKFSSGSSLLQTKIKNSFITYLMHFDSGLQLILKSKKKKSTMRNPYFHCLLNN